MNVLMKQTLVVVILAYGLPLLAQESAAADSPPRPLNEIRGAQGSAAGDERNLSAEKKERLKKIKQQMEQLTVLWEEMQQRKQQAPDRLPTMEPPTVPQPTISRPMPNVVQQPVQTQESPIPDPPPATTPPKTTLPSQSDSERPKEHPVPSPNHESSHEEAGPIDRFGLSSSLFATGHYKECLLVLEALEKSEWSPYETRWAQFLTASCYRKLGEPGEAQRRYRRLVAEDDSEWIGTLSRWWLDEIQGRKKLQQDIKTLATALQQWETEVDELSQQNN